MSEGYAKFRFGKVIGDSFKTLFKKPLHFFLINLIFMAMAFVVVFLVAFSAGIMGFVSRGSASPGPALYLMVILMYVAFGLVYSVFIGANIQSSIRVFSGDTPRIGESLKTGFGRMWSVFGYMLVMGIITLVLLFVLGLTGGLILGFIHPALAIIFVYGALIAFHIFFAPATCAIVVERIGIGAAFGRATELTSGKFWPVLGLYVVCWIILFVAYIVFALVIGAILAAMGVNFEYGVMNAPATIVAFVFGFAFYTWFVAYSLIYHARIYFELRHSKEGMGVEALASTFE